MWLARQSFEPMNFRLRLLTGVLNMKGLVVTLVATLALISQTASGAVSDEDFEQLRNDFELLAQRFEQLAAENVQLRDSNAETAAAVVAVQENVLVVQDTMVVEQPENWTDRISMKGDFRYRYQNDDIDLDDVSSRNRSRIRARAEIVARLPSRVQVGLGMASGSEDPVSTNETLGGGGSSKDLNLDLAYFDWNAIEGANIRGGKFKNTFELVGKSQLQWDGDWRPEGFDAAWDNGTFFTQGLGTYIESDSNKNTDFAYLLQAGGRMDVGEIKLKGGLGYSQYDAQGQDCFFDGADPTGCAGNSVNALGQYLYDFNVLDVFAEAGYTVADLPLTVWGEYIKNSDADDFDTGYQVGAQLGKAKKKGSWQVKTYYQDLEADATVGLLTNSDFGGGGTDGKGVFVSGGYALTDQSNVTLGYYVVERQDSLGLLNGGTPFDVDTFQLDFNFKYD
jgi:hypothetical protein